MQGGEPRGVLRRWPGVGTQHGLCGRNRVRREINSAETTLSRHHPSETPPKLLPSPLRAAWVLPRAPRAQSGALRPPPRALAEVSGTSAVAFSLRTPEHPSAPKRTHSRALAERPRSWGWDAQHHHRRQ